MAQTAKHTFKKLKLKSCKLLKDSKVKTLYTILLLFRFSSSFFFSFFLFNNKIIRYSHRDIHTARKINRNGVIIYFEFEWEKGEWKEKKKKNFDSLSTDFPNFVYVSLINRYLFISLINSIRFLSLSFQLRQKAEHANE